ncbi:DUF4935 domain-containing protein [Clostridium frigoris]|uniref:DUF4935 domain-containing protein n=1 Tax=Clostridium frigoris TaxID=205327 RepID=A0ABS6BXM4_9CLOT|nr:PIN domain-containing protein [Clostridium frigoris]MBU3161346.1 DUF4935 domain-containing protein [Clostridium frigoris]
MSSSKYLIVFDSNILYEQYDKKADFSRFYFNSTLTNIIDKIEELDVYEHIKVAIPIVVWKEMKQQKISAYHKKLKEVKDKIERFIFPSFMVNSENDDFNYETYLEEEIVKYRIELDKKLVEIVDFDLPTSNRFSSIIDRAFKKRPPFEGKDTKSDKGFKDALLWESILEFKSQDKDICILYYTNDKIFNDDLKREYAELFDNSEIKIFRKDEENILMKEIENIAKNIDEYTYIPEMFDEDQDMKDWLQSADFKGQFLKYSDDFKALNKYISFSSIEILDIDNISEKEKINEPNPEMQVNLSAEVTFDVKGATQIKDTYEMLVSVNVMDEVAFSIENVDIEDGSEENE